MTVGTDHLEFSPPPTPGLLSGLALALVAHAMLIALLSIAMRWTPGEPSTLMVQAELWPAPAAAAAAPMPPTKTANTGPTPIDPLQEAGIGTVQDEAFVQRELRLLQKQQEKEEKRRQALRKLKNDLDHRDMDEGDQRPLDPS